MRGPRSTFRGTGRSWRPVLGPLAGSELVFRVAGNVRWVRVAELLRSAADSPSLTGLLTALSGASSILGGASTFVRLLLYAVFFYAFAPDLFPDEFGDWTDEFPFRLLTATIVVSMLLELTLDPFSSNGTVFLGAIAIGTVAYLALFEYRQTDPFDPPDGVIFQILATILWDDSDDWSANEYEEYGQSFGVRLAGGIACCGFLTLTTVLLGVLAYVVSLFFPLPELAILGWSAYGLVAARVDWLSSSDRSTDVESHAYEAVGAAFDTPFKGLAIMFYLVFGYFTSALPFLMFGTVVTELSLGELRELLGRLVRVPAFAMILGLFAFGAYGLWYWWRASRRIPSFIAFTTGKDAKSRVTRPVWLTGPPLALLATSSLTSLSGASYLHAHPSLKYWPAWFSAVAGFVQLPAFALMAVAYARTRATNPQPAETDNRALPMAATAQVVGVVFAAFTVLNYDAVKQDGLAAYVSGLPEMFSLVALGSVGMLIVFYWREIAELADDAEGYRAVVLAAGPAFVLALVGGGMFAVRGFYSTAAVASIVFVCGGCILAYLHERDREEST